MSDGGDQIVSINLSDSQHSNRFCCEDDIKIKKISKNQTVYFSENRQEFGYQYIGKTESGVQIVYTYDGGGESGSFTSIMLLIIEPDYGIIFDEKNSIIKASKPRLLLKKLGEVPLEDRWDGELEVRGNELFIGEDTGWFSFSGGMGGGQFSQDVKDKVIKIDISR